MGPRARRRLVWIVGLALLVAIVAGAALRHFTASAGHSGAKNKFKIGTMNLGVSFGFTTKQVQRRLGRPSEKRAGCWIYRAQDGKVNGIFASSLTDAVRFCFSSGIVSDIKDHDVAHVIGTRHIPAGWGPPLYVAPSDEHTVPLQF